VEEVVRGQGAEPGTTISVNYWRTYWVPLSLVVVLGVGVLAYRILKRTVRVRWLRWALTVVLFVVIFFGAMVTLPMPGMSGHDDFPHDGDRDRLYLKVRSSGEYDALYPRWFGVKR
jgi:heme A synthase